MDQRDIDMDKAGPSPVTEPRHIARLPVYELLGLLLLLRFLL